MRRTEDQMLKLIEELLVQKSHLEGRLAEMKRVSREEEEKFTKQILTFNTDFSLCGSAEAALRSRLRTETLDADREAESLRKEMEEMRRSSSHVVAVQREKSELLLELQDLKNIQTGLDQQLQEAKALSDSLGDQRLLVGRRPLTDSTCLRLKKELELLKEGELELLRDKLRSELHFLRSKLDGVQESEQN